MKSVLVLCTGNSCRSQMAEALWGQLGSGQWQSHSAGSKPAGYVHPLAIRAMDELGLDISGHASKHLSEFQGREFDLVVTVCDSARQSCPHFASANIVLHWPFEDPADATGTDEDKLVVFRRVRDQIRARIAEFLGPVKQ